MFGYLLDRHDSAQAMDILGQSFGHSEIGMEQLQIFDNNLSASRAEDLSKMAMQIDLGRSQIQIPDTSLSPAVNTDGFLTTQMTDGMISLVRNNLDPRFVSLWINKLVYNSNSTKGEIGCYTDTGHCRPPGILFCWATNFYPKEIPNVHFLLLSLS
jgi:hypothetical protein